MASSVVKKPRILVIGSIGIDLVTRTPRMPGAGETISARSFNTGPGGKGANQAVACARASRRKPVVTSEDEDAPSSSSSSSSAAVEVHMVGAVGDDVYGPELRANLKSEGIDISGVETRRDCASGVAVILVEEGTGENRILITAGANGTVEPDMLARVPNEFGHHGAPPGSLTFADRPDLLVMQMEIPEDTVTGFISRAVDEGVPVLLNPAPVPPGRSRPDWLRGIEHLIVNETEAGMLCGFGEEWDSGDDRALDRAFSTFAELGVKNTVITLGAKGACFSLPGGGFEKVPATQAREVVDTTAAGDTFVGVYAVEAVKSSRDGASVGFDMKSAVERACRAATRTVEKAGAIKSIPWMDEIDGT